MSVTGNGGRDIPGDIDESSSSSSRSTSFSSYEKEDLRSESSGYVTGENSSNSSQKTSDDEEEEISETITRSLNLESQPRLPSPPPPSGSWTDILLGAAAVVTAAAGAYYVGKQLFGASAEAKLSETLTECQQIVREIRKDAKEYPVIGLDCQWTPRFDGKRSPVALLQIASHKGNVLLLPMKDFSEIPYDLLILLCDRAIIKAGIEGATKDARFLLADYGIEVNGTFDLRFIAESAGHKPEGLPKLSKKFLNRDLGRDWELVTSDWDVDELEPRQVKYAKEAVLASVDLFHDDD